jgi:hypothetical protein
MKGSRYSLFPIQFVPDTICSRYSLLPIQFVPDTICADTICADTNCADTNCADTICADTIMYRVVFDPEPQNLQGNCFNPPPPTSVGGLSDRAETAMKHELLASSYHAYFEGHF